MPFNEQFVFWGKAVIKFGVGKELRKYPDLPESRLAEVREANLNDERLARATVGSGLHKYLKHDDPALDQQIKAFIREMEQYPVHSNGRINPPKVLSDLLLSVLGSIFVDSNSSYDTVWKTFERLAGPFITPDEVNKRKEEKEKE